MVSSPKFLDGLLAEIFECLRARQLEFLAEVFRYQNLGDQSSGQLAEVGVSNFGEKTISARIKFRRPVQRTGLPNFFQLIKTSNFTSLNPKRCCPEVELQRA